MRRVLALAVVAAAAATPLVAQPASAEKSKIVTCILQHNRIPEPGYGGFELEPGDTVACWLAP